MTLDFDGRTSFYYDDISLKKDSLSVLAFSKSGEIADQKAYGESTRLPGGRTNDRAVRDYMVKKPITVFRKTSLSEVARLMVVNEFGQVPVHGTKDEIVGMIYDVDVLRAITGASE